MVLPTSGKKMDKLKKALSGDDEEEEKGIVTQVCIRFFRDCPVVCQVGVTGMTNRATAWHRSINTNLRRTVSPVIRLTSSTRIPAYLCKKTCDEIFHAKFQFFPDTALSVWSVGMTCKRPGVRRGSTTNIAVRIRKFIGDTSNDIHSPGTSDMGS